MLRRTSLGLPLSVFGVGVVGAEQHTQVETVDLLLSNDSPLTWELSSQYQFTASSPLYPVESWSVRVSLPAFSYVDHYRNEKISKAVAELFCKQRVCIIRHVISGAPHLFVIVSHCLTFGTVRSN